MKIILTTIVVFLILAICFRIFVMGNSNDIETYPYTVIKTYDEFEIRKYEASLFTTVKLNTNEYEKASGNGFSILAGYIFGGNDKNEKIAMTSPVAMTLEDSMTMMFMVPRNIKKENLPKPNQQNIKFINEPEKTVAAIRFGGWASTTKIENYKTKLKAALDAENIEYRNNFYFLGYNPPYDVINRKNEIIVELIEFEK